MSQLYNSQKQTVERTKTEEVAAGIIFHVKQNDGSVESVASMIRHYIDDVLKVIKNINETSLNSDDRLKRLCELEVKYGISKTHIL